jgi:hypothetical protein
MFIFSNLIVVSISMPKHEEAKLHFFFLFGTLFEKATENCNITEATNKIYWFSNENENSPII